MACICYGDEPAALGQDCEGPPARFLPGFISIHVLLLGARMCLIGTSATSNNYNHNDDGRAGFSRIKIDAHRVVQREQGTLIAAKTDGG